MLTLSSSLAAQQRAQRKRPALAVTIQQTRFGIPVIPFDIVDGLANAHAPMDADHNQIDGALLARNNAGALDYSNDNGNSWANVDTVTSGQGFALRWDPVNAVFGLLYGDGNDLKFRTGTGASWSSATTIVTEASAIGAVALAFDDNGDACAFYALGTTTTLKRLRRTSGSWAGSGTNWSRSGNVASVTGISATWSADYYLAVTGTEVTTTNERCWSVAMGDTSLPANVWSALVPIAEADAAAALSFSYPHIALIASVPFVTFQQVEAGNVAASRVMMSAAAEPLGYWSEPFPPIDIVASHGAPLAFVTLFGQSGALLYGPEGYWQGVTSAVVDLSASVTSCSWTETTTSLRVRVETSSPAGFLPTSDARSLVGLDLVLQHGFVTGDPDPGDIEYGVLLSAVIARVSRKFKNGTSLLVFEADGPWEAMARYRAAAAWTAPAGTTRAAAFQRIAGKAGIAVSSASGDLAPSAAWTTDQPAFAIAANETSRSVLLRLLEPTADFLRLEAATGGFQIVGLGNSAADEEYALPQGDEHPIYSLTLSDELGPNWLRLQGPDRYADAFAYDGRAPQLQLVRDFAANDDTKANNAAARALARLAALAPEGELVVPAHVGHELFDLVEFAIPGLEVTGQRRLIGRAVEYKRGPAGGPAYTSTFLLGPNPD